MHSRELLVGDFHQLEHDIAGSPLHSLVSHVRISQLGVARSSRFHLYLEFLQPWDYLLFSADVAHFSDDLSFALAPRARLSEQVIVPIPKIYLSSYSALPLALLALYDIMGVVCARPLAVRAHHLLLNHDI